MQVRKKRLSCSKLSVLQKNNFGKIMTTYIIETSKIKILQIIKNFGQAGKKINKKNYVEYKFKTVTKL